MYTLPRKITQLKLSSELMLEHRFPPRSWVVSLLASVSLLAACTSGGTPLGGVSPPTSTAESFNNAEFLVILTDETFDGIAAAQSRDQRDVAVREIALEILRSNNIRTESQVDNLETITGLVNGFLVVGNREDLSALEDDPRVDIAEENRTVTTFGHQANPPSWGLDRIDQRQSLLSDSFKYSDFTQLTTAYVVDTGIRAQHEEFQQNGASRVTQHVNFVDGENSDCNGHGTHVAGTIAGNSFGVAKHANLVGVKVLNCEGSGTYGTVIAGLNWIYDNARGPHVVNMSLGGPDSASLKKTVTKLVESGTPVVVAAGNSNRDAKHFSPANVPAAITVASSYLSEAEFGGGSPGDKRSNFSNFGTLVDVFAPGTNITSAWHTGNSAQATISGTSMAAPHVAGAVLSVLASKPAASPSDIAAVIVRSSTKGVVEDAKSPNRFLYLDAAQAETANLSPATFVTSEAEQLATTEYWTEAAKESAVPYPFPEVSSEEAESNFRTNSDGPVEQFSTPAQRIDTPENATLATPSRANVSQFPFSTAGMLYFTKNGQRYRCSAQFVGKMNLLLTAAHCLRSRDGAFASRFLFERAHSNGSAVKTFNWRCAVTWNEAVQKGQYIWKYDYGFLKTTEDSDVGHFGLQANTRSRTWTSIGYPSNFDSGRYLQRVPGVRGRERNGSIEFKGNPMRKGSSGGAWIDGLYSLDYVVGLNSHSYSSNASDAWGPKFDGNLWRLFQLAQGTNCKG